MSLDEKISIITPVYNCEKYIENTIENVLKQTYINWELILVDDCSTDNSLKIVEKYAKVDRRIKVFRLKENGGAAKARNKALEESTGRFISYLDSDDLWYKNKLEKQVIYMLEKSIGFSCTSYEVVDDSGSKLNKNIIMKKELDYIGFLTNNLLQTVGIMVDLNYVDKQFLIMPDLRRRQDAATWLQVLKNGNNCFGMKDVLAMYRRTENSLSSNKIKAVKGVWYLYRKVEKLSLQFSIYCFIRYAFLAVWKRIYK